MSDDPLRGELPRHSVVDPLVDPAGDPIQPTDTAGEVTDHIVDVDERLSLVNWRVQRTQRDMVILGIGVVVVLVVVLILGYLLYDQQSSDAASARSERVAADAERARVDGVHRDAICTLYSAARGTYSKSGRDAFPLGPGAYDDFFATLAKGAAPLNCDAA